MTQQRRQSLKQLPQKVEIGGGKQQDEIAATFPYLAEHVAAHQQHHHHQDVVQTEVYGLVVHHAIHLVVVRTAAAALSGIHVDVVVLLAKCHHTINQAA